MIEAFPLQWPDGQPRSKRREDSRFRVRPAVAFEDLMDELHRFGATAVVVSSNIPLRRDGTPYRDGLTELLDDPGVAVYFTKGKRSICLPCDSYRRPWENVRAVGMAVEALRAMERHGAQQILDRAFTGFTALPAPDTADRFDWSAVLGLTPSATPDMVRNAYKRKARGLGGATVELNRARDEGLAAAGGKK